MEDDLKSSDDVEISECIESLALSDMNAPYKLATWFLALPDLKQPYLKRIDQAASGQSATDSKSRAEDKSICGAFAKLVIENDLAGAHLMSNFEQTDFEKIVSLLNVENAKGKSEWIWKCIRYSQQTTNSSAKKPNTTPSTLHWVTSRWLRFQFLAEAEKVFI